MAFNVAGAMRYAQPVSSMYEGRALRQAEATGEQNLRLGAQQEEMNALKIEAAKKPNAEETRAAEAHQIERAKEFMTAGRELHAQTYALYEQMVKGGQSKENAQVAAQAVWDKNRRMVAETFGEDFAVQLDDDGKWTPEESLAGMQQADEMLKQLQGGGDTPAETQNFRDMVKAAGLNEEKTAQAARIALGLESRAGQSRVIDVNGVPTLTGVSDSGQPYQVPLSSLQQTAGAAGTIREAEARGTATGSQGGLSLTPGQKAVDTKFAEDYVAWQAAGGFADVRKNVDQIRSVQQQLDTGRNLTGTTVGNMPRAALAVTNPNALQALEQVEEVVQRNLRLILGAQFTEREGERLIARAYNPRLSEKLNKERLERLARQLEDAAQAKQEAADYFSEKGTLSGWNGRLYSIGDFNPEAGEEDSYSEGDVVVNPETGERLVLRNNEWVKE